MTRNAWFYGAFISLTPFAATQLSAQGTGSLSSRLAAAIDSTVRASMTIQKIPAVSVAISRGSSVVFERSYGMADLENSVPASNATVYRIASVAKPITAVAVMQLVESGKIDLDAAIQQYVPSFPRHALPITVRQLLTHTSGIRHYNNDAEFNSTRHCKQLIEGTEVFLNDTLLHAPGTKITYSTYGFVLLGLAVEQASGMRFTDYLQEHIFKPAHMNSTRQDVIYDIVPGRARGYARTEAGTLRNPELVDTSCRIPGGGLLSTAPDLSRFLIALHSDVLLKPASVAQMFTNQITPQQVKQTLAGVEVPPGYDFPGFGLGWAINTPGRKDALWHGGNQQGTTSIIYWVPAQRLGIAILMNLEAQGNEITSLADRIAAIVTP